MKFSTKNSLTKQTNNSIYHQTVYSANTCLCPFYLLCIYPFIYTVPIILLHLSANKIRYYLQGVRFKRNPGQIAICGIY